MCLQYSLIVEAHFSPLFFLFFSFHLHPTPLSLYSFTNKFNTKTSLVTPECVCVFIDAVELLLSESECVCD